MAQYFFKMSQAEKNNILDQHKTLYDGYVTEYGKGSNMQPLYVQDFANDKNGITVSNTGEVKYYTNTKINEDLDRRDRIGDGPDDLENGTVDLKASMHDEYPSPNEDEFDYISLGKDEDNNSELVDAMEDLYDFDSEEMMEDVYEYDIDEVEDFSTEPLNEFEEDDNLMESVNKSLDMFKRFKNYN